MGSGTLIYLAALQNIPSELYEAAELDGAGLFKRIRHVTIPQTKLILLVMLLLQIVATMQVFIEPYLLTGGGPENATVTVAYLMYQYAFNFGNFGAGSALGLMLMIVLLVFSAFQLSARPRGGQRHDLTPGARRPAPAPAGTGAGEGGARKTDRVRSSARSSRRTSSTAAWGRIIYWTVLVVVVVSFTAAFVFPLYWMITGAMKSAEEIAQIPPTFFPAQPTFGRLPGGVGPARPRHPAAEHRLYAGRRLAVLHGGGRLGGVRAVEAAAGVRQASSSARCWRR